MQNSWSAWRAVRIIRARPLGFSTTAQWPRSASRVIAKTARSRRIAGGRAASMKAARTPIAVVSVSFGKRRRLPGHDRQERTQPMHVSGQSSGPVAGADSQITPHHALRPEFGNIDWAGCLPRQP